MEPKSLALLGLIVFRIGSVLRSEKMTWQREHESRRFKPYHNTSLFLTLQSTGPELTGLCLKGWCERMDDVFIVPYQYVNWHKPTEAWTIQHFSKMMWHSQRLPRQAQWYMFSFDNNYFFVERLVKELAKLDAHLPIYTVLRDPKAKFSHRPVAIFSRFALNSFYEQKERNCEEKAESFEEWLTSCMSVPPVNMSLDSRNKSRVFAMSRHFRPDEMDQMPEGYHDDKEFINSHSDSLLSFTNLFENDLTLLPIFIEKVRGGGRN